MGCSAERAFATQYGYVWWIGRFKLVLESTVPVYVGACKCVLQIGYPLIRRSERFSGGCFLQTGGRGEKRAGGWKGRRRSSPRRRPPERPEQAAELSYD